MTFKATIALSDEYYRVADAKNVAEFNRDLGCEVRERLLQLDYIVDRVRQLEGIAMQPMARLEAAYQAHREDIKARGINYESVPLPENVKLTKEELDVHFKAEFELKLLTRRSTILPVEYARFSKKPAYRAFNPSSARASETFVTNCSSTPEKNNQRSSFRASDGASRTARPEGPSIWRTRGRFSRRWALQKCGRIHP
jgi:hypothetical protein